MEDMLKQFLDIGVVGAIAYVCFKNVMDDKKRTEDLLIKQQEEHKQEIKEITATYIDELGKDRETYIATMNTISSELREVKDDVRTIKAKVGV